jgi:hypothetical protein
MARNAVVILLVGLTASHAAAQATDFSLRRIDSHPLTDTEVAQIAELVADTGKRPWLLRSPRSVVGGLRYANLFLEPDESRPRVRRGRTFVLIADGPSSGPASSPWRIRDSRLYAHIPIAGERPDEVRSDDDIAWPFVLQGEFDDDTLISVVEFVRSQPLIPFSAFLRQVPAAPISGIQRRDDAIVVGFRRSEWENDAVWMVRKDGQWVITRSESSIA